MHFLSSAQPSPARGPPGAFPAPGQSHPAPGHFLLSLRRPFTHALRLWIWRGGRVVYRAALEMRSVARHRGFESHPLRHSSPREEWRYAQSASDAKRRGGRIRANGAHRRLGRSPNEVSQSHPPSPRLRRTRRLGKPAEISTIATSGGAAEIGTYHREFRRNRQVATSSRSVRAFVGVGSGDTQAMGAAREPICSIEFCQVDATLKLLLFREKLIEWKQLAAESRSCNRSGAAAPAAAAASAAPCGSARPVFSK